MTHRQTVTLVGRCKMGKDWPRYPAVYVEGTDRVEDGVFLVQGKPQRVHEYVYQLRYYQGARTKYVTLGKSADNAEMEKIKLEADLRSQSRATGRTKRALPVNGTQRSQASTESAIPPLQHKLALHPISPTGSLEGSGTNVAIKPDIATKIEQIEHLLTVRGIAGILNVSTSNLLELCKSKRIPHVIVGGLIRFDPVITANWLRENSINNGTPASTFSL